MSQARGASTGGSSTMVSTSTSRTNLGGRFAEACAEGDVHDVTEMLKCKKCKGRGKKGLFGPIGFGIITKSCEACRGSGRGVSIETKGAGGASVLILAATAGNFDVVKLLLELGAKVDEKAANGNTALVTAVEGNHSKVVRQLINNRASVETIGSKGFCPLQLAARQGNEETVNLLLGARANLEGKGSADGGTALVTAAYTGYPSIVLSLIKGGANLEAKASGNLDSTAIIVGCYVGNADCVAHLIAGRADLEARSSLGWTALFVAVKQGHVGIVAALLDAHADPHARNTSNGTPISQAEQLAKAVETQAKGEEVLGLLKAAAVYQEQFRQHKQHEHEFQVHQQRSNSAAITLQQRRSTSPSQASQGSKSGP